MNKAEERGDYRTRFAALDGATELAKPGHHVKLPKNIDILVRSLPAGERGAWLRKVVSEAALKELGEKT